MNDETYTPCTKCGRPLSYCKGQCCGKAKGCDCQEYGPKVCGAIRPGEPKCPYQAVIPSLTVESVSNLKDLADCFVHVSDINTTFYIDDKHRIMTTWAGLVSVEDYDFAANPLNLRGQIAYDSKNNTAAIYDKQGANYIFQISGINNDYMLLENKPRINGVTLEGNKTSADLGILEAEDVALVFDTVADMKASTNLVDGSFARTLGFHSVGDGGGALYKISDSGTANEMDVIAVGVLYANLVVPAVLTPEIFGAYGDGTHDDSAVLNYALSFGKVLNADYNKTYKGDIVIPSSYTTIKNLKLVGEITFAQDLQFVSLVNCDIDATDKDYGIYATDNVTKLRMYSVHVHDATLDNVNLVNCWDAILENVSSTGAGRDNFSLDVFNNGYLSGTSYFATNYGIKITNTKACTVIATVQECKKTGVYLNSVLGSDFRVYLEQNGYLGTTDAEKSQMLVGDSARCVGNNITFYAIGGSGSDMESKYGIALTRSDDSAYQGFAEGHLSDGFRCYSNSHGNIYSVTDKTHSFVDYDLPSANPQLYSIDTVTSNTLIDIDTGRDYQYIPVIIGTTAYMVSFNKQSSTQGLVRVTDYNGTNQTVSVNLFKYGSGIKTQ